MTSEEHVQEIISNFMCSKDRDVENFLKERAIEFEGVAKSRTYFIADEDELCIGNFKILAYFSVALQVLKVPVEFSGRKIRALDGLYSKRNGEKITEFPSFLIGQLAKNEVYVGEILGSEIIEYAMSTIYQAFERVGGRIVVVECADKPSLLNFYQRNGFEIIRKDENDQLVQLIRMIG